MATKGTKPNASVRTSGREQTALPDDFPTELLGEFGSLPEQTIANIGTIAGYAIAHGGYFGISTTDDGGSAKLAIRAASLSFEKRVYKLADLDKLLSYSLGKLRNG